MSLQVNEKHDIHALRQKQLFLRENKQIYDKATSFFNDVSKFEECFRCELLSFNKHMMLAVFDSLSYTEEQFVEAQQIISMYSDFVYKPCVSIEYSELMGRNVNGYRTLKDYKELLFIMNNIYESNTLNLMRKSCLILLYCGVDKKQVPYVKKDDVSDSENILTVNGNKRKIPVEFAEILRECKATTFISNNNSRYTSYEANHMKLTESDYLIRSDPKRVEETVSPTFIDKIFTVGEFNLNTQKDLSARRIFQSGFFSWVYEKESPLGITREQFMNYYGIYYGRIPRRYENYYIEYLEWKEIYNK